MHAVKQNNEAMVRALLEAGALVDLVGDPAVGSALQIAIEHDHHAIALLLREYADL